MRSATTKDLSKIPTSIKVAHTAYVTLLVPAYWRHYGPRNFLWFSDVALIGLVPALWREDSRTASTLALAVVLPELPWQLGFFTRLAIGRELFGLSHYMFDARKSRFIRGLSLFHVWLTPLLLWTVHRLGYDRGAFWLQVAMGESVLAASYALASPQENINWVYGPGEHPQSRVPRRIYLAAVMLLFPVCVWWPTHRLLSRWFAAPRTLM